MERDLLKKLGFDERFEREAAVRPDLEPARVTEQHREIYTLAGVEGSMRAVVSGRMAYESTDTTDYPAVGDWVLVDRADTNAGTAVIRAILPRKSVFERRAAGTSRDRQIVAANIDIVFICMSLNADFNLRRLERYLAVAWSSGARPVVVLTKSDLAGDMTAYMADIDRVSAGADVLVTSSALSDGLEPIGAYLAEGRTIAFIGSSGVGKSTMINRLAGKDLMETKSIREDDSKGRHATTHRQLILLPDGGVVIDTPGMRELQLDLCDVDAAFEEIEELAGQCRFKDCTHGEEPGCAVRQAIDEGRLSEERLRSYKKLQKEAYYAGLDSKSLEQAKIEKMFGSKGEMKQAMRYLKKKRNQY